MTILQLLDAGELCLRVSRDRSLDEDSQSSHVLLPGRGERYMRNRAGEDYSRYEYDETLCARSDGWQQFDTHQDAWYFGVWVHPERQVIVTFAEGDETVEVFTNREAFADRLDHLNAVYRQKPAAVALDAQGRRTEYYDKRITGADVRQESSHAE